MKRIWKCFLKFFILCLFVGRKNEKKTHEVSGMKIFALKSLKCVMLCLKNRGGHFAMVLCFNSYICIETLTPQNSFTIC